MSAQRIIQECNAIRDMLVAKNRFYGDSATNPIRVFSHSDPVEQLRVRIDDKLSRLARGKSAGEDVVLDLIGYLVLLRIAEPPRDPCEAELIEAAFQRERADLAERLLDECKTNKEEEQ